MAHGIDGQKIILVLIFLPFIVTQIITTVAGSGALNFGGDGGQALNASFNVPVALSLDLQGNLLVADIFNCRVRKIHATTGIITTVAGNGICAYGGDGGQAINASLNFPAGLFVDLQGNLFIADQLNNRIRKVEASGVITTIAGNGTAAFCGDGGPAITACLNNPFGIFFDPHGDLFIADHNNHRIRKVDSFGLITTVVGNGTGTFAGDGGSAINACVFNPRGVFVDQKGNLFVVDTFNDRIRTVNATTRIITTFAGGSFGLAGDQGPAKDAKLSNPRGIFMDFQGNMYIADERNHRIRKVDIFGVITTFAGNGTTDNSLGFGGDGGLATVASLNRPSACLVDSQGDILIADTANQRIRKVTLPLSTGTTATTTSASTGSTTLFLQVAPPPVLDTTTIVAVVVPASAALLLLIVSIVFIVLFVRGKR